MSGEPRPPEGAECAPAARRNQGPILALLRQVLPASGAVLEIASGTGQHVVAFARAFPGLDWQPSDPDPRARTSIAAWAAQAGLGNLRPPLSLDVTRPGWERVPRRPVQAIVCINLLQVAPWAACEGLMRGAGRLFEDSGVLYLYGPFARGGRHTAPSNEAFDRALRLRDPAWGVRDVDDVVACARRRGLDLERTLEMPANNLSVVLRRIPQAPGARPGP